MWRVVIVSLLLAGAARADRPLWEWRQPVGYEIAMLATADALIWIDIMQARSIIAHAPRVHEQNPLLGDNPSAGRMFWVGGILSTLALTATWYALPSGWRIVPCGAVIGGESFAIVYNSWSW